MALNEEIRLMKETAKKVLRADQTGQANEEEFENGSQPHHQTSSSAMPVSLLFPTTNGGMKQPDSREVQASNASFRSLRDPRKALAAFAVNL